MSDYQRIQDRDDLENRISDVLTDYLKDKSVYENIFCLQIDPRTLDVKITPQKEGIENLFPLSDFIGSADKEIDYDQVYDVASRYVFVQ